MHVIDCQWHWYPPALLDEHVGRSTRPRAQRSAEGYVYEVSPDETWRYDRRFTDLDYQVEVMDRAGIDTAVVSCAVAGDVSDRNEQEAYELCILLNEELSRAQVVHPGRFVGLAHLPLAYPDRALDVLDDATSRLGLRGVWLPANINGQSVAEESQWQLYTRAEELGIPLFLHPTRSFRLPTVTPYDLEIPIGYMFDTSFATMSLIAAGVLDRHPGLKLVHPHAGGTLPFLTGRIEVYQDKGWWPNLQKPFIEYLRGMWFDVVCNQSSTLRLLIDTVGADRCVFSSDYPYWSTHEGLKMVRDTATADEVPGILGANALNMLGLTVPPTNAARSKYLLPMDGK